MFGRGQRISPLVSPNSAIFECERNHAPFAGGYRSDGNKKKKKKRELFLPLDTAFRTLFLANFSVNDIGKGKDEGGGDTERTVWMSKEGERSDKRNIERLLS